jgi:hypothetical protein
MRAIGGSVNRVDTSAFDFIVAFESEVLQDFRCCVHINHFFPHFGSSACAFGAIGDGCRIFCIAIVFLFEQVFSGFEVRLVFGVPIRDNHGCWDENTVFVSVYASASVVVV